MYLVSLPFYKNEYTCCKGLGTPRHRLVDEYTHFVIVIIVTVCVALIMCSIFFQLFYQGFRYANVKKTIRSHILQEVCLGSYHSTTSFLASGASGGWLVSQWITPATFMESMFNRCCFKRKSGMRYVFPSLHQKNLWMNDLLMVGRVPNIYSEAFIAISTFYLGIKSPS